MKIRGKLLAGMNLQTETWRSTRSLSLSQGEGHRNIKSLRKYCCTPRMSHWQPPELWGQWWWWCFENPLELRFSSLLQMGYIITWAPATSENPTRQLQNLQNIMSTDSCFKSFSKILQPGREILIPAWTLPPDNTSFIHSLMDNDTWRFSIPWHLKDFPFRGTVKCGSNGKGLEL